MKIKTTMRYHFLLVRMVTVKKKQKIASIDVKKSEPLCTDVGNVKMCNHYGRQYGSSQNIIKRTSIKSSNPTSGLYPK